MRWGIKKNKVGVSSLTGDTRLVYIKKQQQTNRTSGYRFQIIYHTGVQRRGRNGLRLQALQSYYRGSGEARKLGRIQKSLEETEPVKAEIKRQLTFSNGRQCTAEQGLTNVS